MKSMIGGILNKTPVRYTGSSSSPWQYFFGDHKDKAAQMRTMGSVWTMFAIVHRLSTSVAAVNWRLYRKNIDSRRVYGPLEDRRQEVTSHLALDLWNRPNPFYTRQAFVETFMQHHDLTGEAEWMISRDPRVKTIPLELWSVRPDRIKPVPHPTRFLEGWVYHGPEGEEVPLGLDEV